MNCVLAAVVALLASSLTVPMKQEHGVLYLQVRVDGAGPLLVTFDPGGEDVYTSYARTHLNGRAPKTVCLSSACYPARMQYIDGDPNQLDPQHDSHAGIIAGSIGPSLLREYVACVDYRNSTLTLTPATVFRAPPAARALPLTFDSYQMPVAQAEVDGVAAPLEIDVRAGTSMLFSPFVARTKLDRTRVVHTVKIAGYTLQDVRITSSMATSGKFASSEVAGLLGNNLLSRFALTLDFQHRNAYLGTGC